MEAIPSTKISAEDVERLLDVNPRHFRWGRQFDYDVADELVRSGLSLTDIGRAIGISREGVRQALLKVQGDREPALAESRRVRREARDAANRAQRRVVTRRPNSMQSRLTKSHAEIQASLYAVQARHGGAMSHKEYNELKDPEHVSSATIMKRYDGSWIRALQDAGLPFNRRNSARVYTKYSYEDKVAAVAACIHQTRVEAGDFSIYVGNQDYDTWARKRLKKVPSLATVRLGGVIWSQVHADAIELLYGEVE